jgi:epoxide hydrolase 4
VRNARQEGELVKEAELHHEMIRGAGIDLHVVRAGEGPPVVLLHGFPENWSCWRQQISPLVQAGFAVLVPDLRGYHLSERPSGRAAYRLHHLVQDVAALLDNSGHACAHLVGHDWGGIIAWAFAGTYPEKLKKLIILNAPHPRIYLQRAWRPPQLLRSWYILFFQLPFLPERLLMAGDFALLRRIFRCMPVQPSTFSPAEIDGYIAALAAPGALRAALNYYRANLPGRAVVKASRASIAAETLVIWGERDQALGMGLLKGLEEMVPRVRVHRLPEVGHWVQEEAPQQVNDLLVEFLLRQDSGP